MEIRTLGQTGLKVSALSFGASSLGDARKMIDEQESIRTVLTAADLGINLFDVSPYYGHTASETILGKAIKQLPRDQVILSTKTGRYDVDKFDFSPARIVSSLEESMRRLQTDYIDIFQLHDIEFTSLDDIIEESIPVLQKLKAQGKIRFYGVTGLPLNIFRRVLDRVPLDTILTYCHYTLNDDSLMQWMTYLQSHQVGIMNASPLGMGLLTRRGAPPWHPASDRLKEVCCQAARYCEQRGADIAKLAIQFTVSNREIPTTLVGSANAEHIKRCIHWIEEPMDEQLLKRVLEILRPIARHTWPQGRPENQ